MTACTIASPIPVPPVSRRVVKKASNIFSRFGSDNGIIRKKWNYQGVVITDDLVMGAIYQHNVCTAVVEALNAGVDLLLVAYDGAQFYHIFACACDASGHGKLDPAMLRDSEARLKRAFPLD